MACSRIQRSAGITKYISSMRIWGGRELASGGQNLRKTRGAQHRGACAHGEFGRWLRGLVHVRDGFSGGHCGLSRQGRDDFHVLPIVRELASAIEADHVGSGEAGRVEATLGTFGRDGEAVVRVPATEDEIEKSVCHIPPPGSCSPADPQRRGTLTGKGLRVSSYLPVHLFRFQSCAKGSRELKKYSQSESL